MKNNLINLKNKFCFVTGSNGHIGKAICKKLLKLEAIVIPKDLSIDSGIILNLRK
tara:strand:- start:257 stop:421 length:165 start_codon:yes stop_codon:yes gene_type:complete